jgi:hypothetical protein
MPLNDKIRLILNSRELISGDTDIDIDDAVALLAGEVVVVLASTTHTVVMCPICKLNPGEQSPGHQLFDRTVDRGSAYTWLSLS